MEKRILLVDDHEIVRFGLCALLEKEGNLKVVGQAENGLEAIELAGQLDPDLIVMDMSMPNMNGVEATRHIRRILPDIQILVLSMYDRRQFVLDMLKAGVNGYVLKTRALEEVVSAVNTVLSGEMYLSPRITQILAKEYQAGNQNDVEELDAQLTPKERQVLQLLAEGKSSKEIGQMLGSEERTVVSHRQHIMDKVDIRSIAGLTKYAVRHGITSLEA
jgi:DNA-binding NarL/FixJ family response regulator